MFTILHCADLHLEASFASGHLPPAVGIWRRAALQATLGRILHLAREHQAAAVTIAGDLFEHEYALPDTAEFLREQFAALAPTRVLIAPGERDPYGDDSLYALTAWPENVAVFAPGRLTCHELAPGLCLWGAGYALGAPPRVLDGFRVDRDGTHLLLLHAAWTAEPGAEGPFHVDAAALQGAGFHCALLGHEHSGRSHLEGAARYVYPGSPEPLCEADAAGDHLAVLVTVDGSACTPRAIPISQWRYLSLRVDLSGSSTIEEAAALVRVTLREAGAVDERAVCRVTLTGVRRFELDMETLRSLVNTTACVQYEAEETMAHSVEQMAYEPTLRGELVRRFQSRLSGVSGAGERTCALRALNLGLRVLEGKQVRSYESG